MHMKEHPECYEYPFHDPSLTVVPVSADPDWDCQEMVARVSAYLPDMFLQKHFHITHIDMRYIIIILYVHM